MEVIDRLSPPDKFVLLALAPRVGDIGSVLDVIRRIAEQTNLLALVAIAKAIAQINERNLSIASATEEQSHVAREVDSNLLNIRDVSAQTSAGANQTQASSQELAGLAGELNGIVRHFIV